MTSNAPYPNPFPKEHLFWKHVQVSKGCWRWTGARNVYGYGMVTRFIGGVKRQLMAHRVAFELMVGPIPSRLVIDHLCRNTLCVNPAHLEPVTDRVNILRGVGVSAIAARRRHCPKGHEYTGRRDGRGARVCVECVRIKNAIYLEQERVRLGRGPHNRDKTHCLRGHPLDGSDIHIDKNGRRHCRACERERRRVPA